MNSAQRKCDIGLIGLAVMGENLVLNMESHGYQVAVFNRTTSKVDAFMDARAKGKNIVGCHSVEALVANLERPRKLFLLVKAGAPVYEIIVSVIRFLEPGYVIIVGGISHSPIPYDVRPTLKARVCCTSEPVFQVVRKARSKARLSCQVDP
jgi:6-phosphogluconate dehydrogenase